MQLKEKNSTTSFDFPNKKNEEYKYCDIEKYWNAGFQQDISLDRNKLNELIENFKKEFKISNNDCLIIIANGMPLLDLSLNIKKDGLEINTLNFIKENKAEFIENYLGKISNLNDPTVAINTENYKDGLFINIKKNTLVSDKIVILNISVSEKNFYTNSRTLLIAEENTQSIISEFYLSKEGTNSFTNHVSEFFVGENSNLKLTRFQDPKDQAHLICNHSTKQSKNSFFADFLFTFSGSLVRNNTNIILSESNSEANLNGLYLLKGNQLVDNHTLVDHQVPNCYSNELYKGVLDDKSTGVFNGKIFVRKDAQKTNAYQSNKNILLSSNATINTKPQLEIYADDVKCSHGTSTGKLDESALFYLKSRGIGLENARKLLLLAFVSDVYQTIPSESLKEYIQNRIETTLS